MPLNALYSFSLYFFFLSLLPKGSAVLSMQQAYPTSSAIYWPCHFHVFLRLRYTTHTVSHVHSALALSFLLTNSLSLDSASSPPAPIAQLVAPPLSPE